jgi:polysaccharide export outer membrane protein
MTSPKLKALALVTVFMMAVGLAIPAYGQESSQQAQTGPGTALVGDTRVVGADYVIGARDLLDIRVFGIEDLDSKVRVSETGTVSLPLVGELPVAGMTTAAFEATLEIALRRWLTEPDVSVFVEGFESMTFSVMGAVNGPGTYGMVGRMSLLEALTRAGGVDNGEASGTVNILRGNGDPLKIDLNALLYDPDPAFNVDVAPGDLISVQAKPTFAIYVHGAVMKSGSYTVRQRVSLLQAITLAGGFSDRAAKDRVKVLRRLADGTTQEIEANLKRILEGKAEDILLEPNDIVVVPETFF